MPFLKLKKLNIFALQSAFYPTTFVDLRPR